MIAEKLNVIDDEGPSSRHVMRLKIRNAQNAQSSDANRAETGQKRPAEGFQVGPTASFDRAALKAKRGRAPQGKAAARDGADPGAATRCRTRPSRRSASS